MKFRLSIQYLTCLLIILPMGCSVEDFGKGEVYEINSSVSPTEGGSINSPTGNFEAGEKVTIEAIAAEGYLFKNWAGDISGSNNPYTLTINSNTTIIAIFEKKDTDKDGITDDKDTCPNTPVGELVNTSGCSESQLDSDGDGVSDDIDECPGTEEGQNVDEQGCSPSQTDSDGDGVYDDSDLCQDTLPELNVDESGCADNQKDTDNDGVSDDIDQCPNTLADTEVDHFGCSEGETDGDNDGVLNADDNCPNTPSGESVNEEGCSVSQTDSDNDGVTDNNDLCPDTPSGAPVDVTGCAASERDSDNDGITDDNDQCPGSPFDQLVDDNGCSVGQNDSDGDGIFDDVDDCPDTNPNDTADSNGCSEAQKDTDNDGVTNDIDQCPNTSSNEGTDENGCSASQKDSDGDGVTDDKDQCPETSAGNNVDETGCEIAEKTYVPDDNFEQILIDLGYDEVLDDYVLTNNINSVTELTIIEREFGSGINISDYTGLEDFAALEKLYFRGTANFTNENLDLTNNLNLKSLTFLCSDFDGVDLSKNLMLEDLTIGGGNDIDCMGSSIKDLDLSENLNLKTLSIGLTGIDDINLILRNAPTIENFKFIFDYSISITLLDFTYNTNLRKLEIGLGGNFNGELFLINLKNGENQKIEEIFLNSTLESWETCIQVDDPSHIERIISGNDVQFTVSQDCSNGDKTYVPDDTFEQNLIYLGLDDLMDNYVLTNNINDIKVLELRNMEEVYGPGYGVYIADFTGLQDFGSLEEFTFNNIGAVSNEIIDLSSITNLKKLRFEGTSFYNIDLSNNQSLEYLSFSSDPTYSDSNVLGLDLTNNTNLKFLAFGNAGITYINQVLLAVPSLEELVIWNQGEDLDLTSNVNLKRLTLIYNAKGVDFINIQNGNNQKLESIRLEVTFTNLNWEPCIQVDDPSHVENIITTFSGDLPINYTVTTNCVF